MVTKKDKFLASAQKFLEKGSLDKALGDFQKAAHEDPKDTRTWLRIAEIHVKRGEDDLATQVYLNTADLYVEQGFFQRAVAVYKNVLKLSPGHVEAHFKLADVYKQLGLFSDAAQQYDQAAGALQKAGRLKEAMSALTQIVELNPDNVGVRIKLAEVAAQGGQTEEAVREFGRAAEQLEGQGRVDEFLRVAERLLVLQPQNLALAKKVASRYIERQSAKFALAKLQTCFNADPKDAETLSLLANAFEQLGQIPKTVSVLKELVKVYDEHQQPAERNLTVRRILALAPDDAEAQALAGRQAAAAAPVRAPTTGLRRRELSDHEGYKPAITFSQIAVPTSLQETNSQRLAIAEQKATRERPAVARIELEGEADGDPGAEVQRIIAEVDVFVKYGMVERAAEHVRKVFDLVPGHLDARERLAAILLQLGRRAEAVTELEGMGEQLMATDPAEAEKVLQRALEVDPQAPGALELLSRLKSQEGAAPASELDVEIDSVELEVLGDAVGDSLELEVSSDLIDSQDLLSSPELEVAPALEVAPEVEAAPEPPHSPILDLPPELLEPEAAVPTAITSEPHTDEMVTAPPEEVPELPGLVQSLAGAAPQPAEIGDSRAYDNFQLDLGGHTPAPAPAPAAAEPLFESLELPDLEAPAPAAPEPLPPAVLGELEQIDFFLDQELPDEARALLDDIAPTYAQHPEVVQRRQRLDGPAEMDSVPQAVSAEDTGAVPMDAFGAEPSRAGYKPSVTPVAVVAGGGADLATHRDLGIAYKEMGLFDPAIAEFAHLVEDPASEVFALTMTGECYEAKGVPTEALLHYKKALNRPNIKDEEATTLYFQLGRVFQGLGDGGEALFFFEKVARRDPNFQDVGERMATLRAQGVAPLERAPSPGSRAAAGGGGGERGRR